MTEVTIELTDEEVAWLRSGLSWGSTVMSGAILRKARAALPQPIKLTIELSSDVIGSWERHFRALHDYTPGADGLTGGEAEALNAVRSAVKAWIES